MEICMNLTVESFLRALQKHILVNGLPSLILSDLGSQITAATNIIRDFLKDPDTQNFLVENNIKTPVFGQYFKGNSALGSLVEICVKFIKRLIYGAIRKRILDYFDFDLIVAQMKDILNKRPIAFKQSLRDKVDDEVPQPITPELLIKGYYCATLNIIPDLQPTVIDEEDKTPTWGENLVKEIKYHYNKLSEVRKYLIESYNKEFLTTLIDQAIDKGDRYKPVKHTRLQMGDIVLLKEKYLKRVDYPMGIVKKVIENEMKEITGVEILKGTSKEVVKRHVNSVIPLLAFEETTLSNQPTELIEKHTIKLPIENVIKPQRKAAQICREKCKQLVLSEAV